MDVLAWTFFVITSLISISLFIMALVITFSEDDSSGSYLFCVSALFLALLFFISKEVLDINIAIRIWKIAAAVIVSTNFIVFLILRKPRMHCFFSSLITFAIGGLPFYLGININPSHSVFLDLFNNNYPQVLFSFWLPLFFIVVVFAVIMSKKRNNIYINNQEQEDDKNKYGHIPNFETSLYRLTVEEITERFSKLDFQMSRKNDELRNMYKQINDLCHHLLVKIDNNSQGMNEVLPISMFNNIDVELRDIKKILTETKDKNKYSNSFEINSQTIIKELYHFLLTPLSSIEANCISMEAKIRKNKIKELTDNIDIVKNNVTICKGVLNTYREVELLPTTIKSDKKLSELILSAFEIYKQNQNRNIRIKIEVSDSYKDINHYYIMSIILPLLENAITASKENSVIEIKEKDNIITITNECEQEIDIDNLEKQGYSSKNNHTGTGLFIVRHLLKARGIGELNVFKTGLNVSFQIKINKNEYN